MLSELGVDEKVSFALGEKRNGSARRIKKILLLAEAKAERDK